MVELLPLAAFEDFWGNPERRTNPYGSPGSIYSLGYHIAEDISALGAECSIPILRAGTVVESSRASKIGGYFAVKVPGDPYHDIYCHARYASTPSVGERVVARQNGGQLAQYGDALADRGLDWNGAHCHFVQSLRPDGAYNVFAGNDRNPNPSILAALKGLSLAGESTTAIIPKRRKRPVINYVKASTLNPQGNGVAGKTLCATAGMSAGTPANWVEYFRGASDGVKGTPEQAILYRDQFGPHIPLSDAAWGSMKADFLAPITTK